MCLLKQRNFPFPGITHNSVCTLPAQHWKEPSWCRAIVLKWIIYWDALKEQTSKLAESHWKSWGNRVAVTKLTAATLCYLWSYWNFQVNFVWSSCHPLSFLNVSMATDRLAEKINSNYLLMHTSARSTPRFWNMRSIVGMGLVWIGRVCQHEEADLT